MRLKATLQNIALLGVSTLVTLLLIELVLRLVQPAPPEHRQPHVKYVYVPCDAGAGRHSDYFYLEPGQSAFHLEATVSTNRLGIRDREIEAEKPGDVVRVLAMGDSHTFGYGVPNEDSWPRQLAHQLDAAAGTGTTRYEVINAGIEGLSLQQELQFFRERLAVLEPDYLILAYYWNDMPISGGPEDPLQSETVAAEFRSCHKPAATRGGESSEASLPQRFLAGLKSVLRESYLVYFLVQRLPFLQLAFFPDSETSWKKTVLQGDTTPRVEASWGFVREQLVQWRQLGADNRFQLVILVIPLFEQMTTGGYPDASYQSRLTELGAEIGIPVIDPLAAIRAIDPSYPADFVPFDGHPTGRIYQAIAQEVFGYLMEHEASGGEVPRAGPKSGHEAGTGHDN